MRAPAREPAHRASCATRLLLPLLVLVTAASTTSATRHLPLQHQTYILCTQPSHPCVAWPVAAGLEDAARWDLPTAETCGLLQTSDIEAPPAHYTIKALYNEEVRNVFCDAVIITEEFEAEATRVSEQSRVRRQTVGAPRGRYRGQTQSQYLAVDRDGKDEGKAEAHSAADSSRASVSGNSGMGQAQSQSMYEPSCDDCYGNVGTVVAGMKKHPQGTNGFSAFGPGQNGGPGWVGPPNSGSSVGTTYVNNQNAKPGLENYGRPHPSAPSYERGYGVPTGGNGLTPGGVVGPTQGRNQNIYPVSGGTPLSQGEPQSSYRPGLGGPMTQYGPNQQGNGGYGSNQQVGPRDNARPEQGNRYGSDSGGYGPGQIGTPGGGGNYPPGSLMSAPGRGGLGPAQPGGIMSNGASLPNQIGLPGQVYNQMEQRGPGYGPGGSTHGGYGPGKNGALTPNINSGPLHAGPNNVIPGNQGQSGTYNPKQTGVPNGLGGSTSGGVTNPQGVNSNQGGVPGYGSSPGTAGNNMNPAQGGNWPIASYSPGSSPYFCCVVGPDGKIIPAGGSPFNRGIGNPYPNINNQYGYSGLIPGSTDQSKGLSNMPGQSPYGISGSGNGVNSFGIGQGNNYGPSQGPGNFITGTGQVPQGGSPDRGTISGSGNYVPNRNLGSFSPDTTGGGGSFAPNLIGTDQTRPSIGGTPMAGTGYHTNNGLGPNVPNSGMSYGPVGNGGPGTGGYSPIGGTGEIKQYIPGQIGIPGGEDTYVHGQGGIPMANRNFGSGSPGDSSSYVPGQDGRPSTGGNFGPGQGNNLGGVGYGPGQVSAPENIRSYEPGQIVGPGGGGYRVSPGDGTRFYNTYGPHKSGVPGGAGIGTGSGDNPQSGSGTYGPGQTNGMGGGNIGSNMGSHPGSTGSFSTGQNVGPETIGYGNYGPGQNGGSGVYIPGSSNGMGNYGPSGVGQVQNGPVGAGPYGSYQGGQGSYPQGQPSVSGIGSYQPGQSGKPGESYGSVGVPGDGGRYSNGQPNYGTDFTDRYGGGVGGNGYNARYPGLNNEYNGIPQNFTDVGNLADGDDSEAEASVSQAANGTTASATSRGGNDKGRAQTNVHGTYTGSGSFSAQAQITGENKEAESQVTGGKKGASSSAQGSGRNNKSQANVQLGSETGSVQTQSLTSGAYHSSNSQVQGSVKGGMADAQARGPGSTSSQAQIGFTPYKDGDKSHDTQKIPFVGGGVASAQSSGRTGQSQSQLHGTFRYGITYNGAAQAGASIDKDAVFPNRLSFDKIDVFDESEKNINVDTEKTTELDTPAPVDTTPSVELVPSEESLPALDESSTEGGMTALDTEDTEDETVKNDETLKNSETRYSSHTHLDHHKTNGAAAPSASTAGVTRSFQSRYGSNGGEYEYTTDREDAPTDEYDSTDGAEEEQGEYSNYDDIPRDTLTHQSLQAPRKTLDVRQTTGGNTQHIVLGTLDGHDAAITQKSSERPDESRTYQPGERVPGTGGYTIPAGFTGSVKSVASKERTYVVGSRESPSQAQTVTLTPGSGRIRYAPSAGYGRVGASQLRSLARPRGDPYVSVSKSVARDLDADDHVRKQYSHSYYTKSSSCGFFTFTCTMVSDAEGKKKVCRPKIPTNPDGTPIKC
ncbi:uncharacterized transmembrane protein DDB_G0289901-like [Papilio machaon]|uniref:uncharacterized transmembrane protein DDB_G0289901-like n=1 Tax=Papilio machaon TaxID=76193 RepID=UPI001E662E25|nr:uncharacterized transmembrane protein DDB_G0289901-like [Papilio machaon]